MIIVYDESDGGDFFKRAFVTDRKGKFLLPSKLRIGSLDDNHLD